MKDLLVVLVVIVGIGLLGLSSCAGSAAQEESGEQIMGNILNRVMDYIKQSHLDAAPFIKENTPWTKSSSVKRMGYSGYTYAGGGWVVSIGHSAAAEMVYDVRAEYDDKGIVWVGTIKDDIITEESYIRK